MSSTHVNADGTPVYTNHLATRRVRICASTPTIRSTGTRGDRKHSSRRERTENPFI